MLNFLKSFFDSNEKQIRKVRPILEKINKIESEVSKMSFEEMRNEVEIYRKELKVLVDKVPLSDRISITRRDFKKPLPNYELEIIKKLQEYAPRLFAFLREINSRKYGRRHFDVQIIAALILAQGNKLVELKTGEGKTQVFHLPAALYALTGRGSHVVTVNDYLARRDGEYAGHIFSELGISLGVITPEKSFKFVSDLDLKEIKGEEVYNERMRVNIKNPGDARGWNLVECSKKEAYECDVVYGTNNEFGFDFLRDNMARELSQIVQRELYFCIVDEVDSILIDEARTPLIISSPAAKSNDLYVKFASIVKELEIGKHFVVDEKEHAVTLTDEGIEKVEKMLGVDNLWEDYRLAYHLENALKAQNLYKIDDEYIVKNGEVLIVDQFTGRVLPGRRYSEGLHQAIEAKEGVEIKQESKTLATITFQNYFRLYKVLGGGSGTVLTEAEEFYKIYNLDSVAIPTNKPIIRKDFNDRIYKNQEAKFKAVVAEIVKFHKKKAPVLVGTTSVEKSELLSKMLKKIGIEHEVLNAKYHEKEAEIIAKAGQKGAVTIATNMAGRGTDIRLGEGVNELGGLNVIGTERHEARRIDNQLRGRSGRQGDNGTSRFFVALDDEIMRLRGGDFIKKIMEKTNMPDDLPIESPLVSSSIERAQKLLEGYHFDIRNSLVKYDDVMNEQREVFYKIRRKILELVDKILLLEDKTEDQKKELDKAMKNADKKFLGEIKEEINEILEKSTIEKKRDDKNIIDSILDFGKDEDVVKCLIEAFKEINKKSENVTFFVSNDSRKTLENLFKKLTDEELRLILYSFAEKFYQNKKKDFEQKEFYAVFKYVYLEILDEMWSDHLDLMQDLREGIGLRGIAQRDPLVEYKNEAYLYFKNFVSSSRSKFVRRVFKVYKAEKMIEIEQELTNQSQIKNIQIEKNEIEKKGLFDKRTTPKIFNAKSNKVRRNDPCPCGSGKKYKKCHGKVI